MKAKLKNGFFIAILFFLTSCDCAYEYTYRVMNYTDSEVKVKIERFDLDSVYVIPPDGSQDLFVANHGPESCKFGPEPTSADVKFDLNSVSIEVIKNNVISTKNYLDTAVWKYENQIYRSEIHNDEFK